MVIKTVPELTVGLGCQIWDLKVQIQLPRSIITGYYWSFHCYDVLPGLGKNTLQLANIHILYVKTIKKGILIIWNFLILIRVICSYLIKFIDIVLTVSKTRSNSAAQSVRVHPQSSAMSSNKNASKQSSSFEGV